VIREGGVLRWEVDLEGEEETVVVSHDELNTRNGALFLSYRQLENGYRYTFFRRP
jgi:hypothetical protein